MGSWSLDSASPFPSSGLNSPSVQRGHRSGERSPNASFRKTFARLGKAPVQECKCPNAKNRGVQVQYRWTGKLPHRPLACVCREQVNLPLALTPNLCSLLVSLLLDSHRGPPNRRWVLRAWERLEDKFPWSLTGLCTDLIMGWHWAHPSRVREKGSLSLRGTAIVP